MSTPYRKVTVYVFEADRQTWEVTSFTEDRIDFEETRKNGQEDTHVSGFAYLEDGRWKLDEHMGQMVRRYCGGVTEQALLAFFNEHGPPTETTA